MSDSIIKVEGLGKKYIISHETKRGYTALRDVISNKAKGLVKRDLNLPAREEFWALKDVSFEIKKGEAVGIIGRNGAGKSTLLKILSRITEPTTGRIELNGRVASLLEVGTGFHPELTGRENIFLNGAILGMSRVEIRRKFDEIVDFSGVEKFLDTPVKRYSSGMYVRLAFAVAAHLEPEILVVDEVLAVGDAEFQKKCLGKMNDVSRKEGRTVLFVSHNMDAVRSLCQKGILLNSGLLSISSSMDEILKSYLRFSNETLAIEYELNNHKDLQILKIALDKDKLTNQELEITISYYCKYMNSRIVPGWVIYNIYNIPIMSSNTNYHPATIQGNEEKKIKAVIKNLELHSGLYKISFWLGDGFVDTEFKDGAIIFEYVNPNQYSYTPELNIVGSIDKICKWSFF